MWGSVDNSRLQTSWFVSLVDRRQQLRASVAATLWSFLDWCRLRTRVVWKLRPIVVDGFNEKDSCLQVGAGCRCRQRFFATCACCHPQLSFVRRLRLTSRILLFSVAESHQYAVAHILRWVKNTNGQMKSFTHNSGRPPFQLLCPPPKLSTVYSFFLLNCLHLFFFSSAMSTELGVLHASKLFSCVWQ